MITNLISEHKLFPLHSTAPVKPDLEICFEGIGHYPDPGNTTCFYHCDANNYAHHRCCAPGLAFNPEIRSCDW